MASRFIPITLTDTNARFALDLKRASDLTRQLMDTLDGIVDRGFRFLGEEEPDFAAFEAAYGLASGAGQTVFDVVNGTKQALNGQAQNANAVDLRDRIG